MLVSLKMTCWRQHVERSVAFTEGLNAVRGPNEGGKTSLLLAVVYALFGVKAMPQPLAELVTWGRGVRELEVVLVIRLRGELYEFKRGDSGAECRHSGGTVTGQNEVSKFAEELLGVERNIAVNMMFAGQGGLRGALEGGPKALAQYIENLSGMDLFDRLLDAAQTKLATGPTKALDTEIAMIEDSIEALDLTAPDTTAIDGKLAQDLLTLEAAKVQVAEAKAAVEQAGEAAARARAQAETRRLAEESLKRAQGAMVRAERNVEALARDAEIEVDEERLKTVSETVDGAVAASHRAEAFRELQALPAYPESYWEGDVDSIKRELNDTLARVKKAQDLRAELNAQIREARAKKVTASACGYCGKDFSEVPEVAAANAEIDAACQTFANLIVAQDDLIRAGESDLRSLQAVLNSAQPWNNYAEWFGQYVDVDRAFVPPRITWKGEPPQELPDLVALRNERDTLSANHLAKTIAVSRLEEAKQALEVARDEVASQEQDMPAAIDSVAASVAHMDAREALREREGHLAAVEQSIRDLNSRLSAIRAGHEQAKRRHAELVDQLATKKQQREALVFNNTLVKKIRAARPIVAAKLWDIILASVSTMFSQVRGTKSVVARTANGFTVNGHAIEGLSGSALDVLGMALRVALIKSFVPDCSFLVLDEPMSACDDDRTAAMLGFLAACDFTQTILITHEGISETSADNLILI
jgi:DNA repair exonuclease SbcCD ATPase subunit